MGAVGKLMLFGGFDGCHVRPRAYISGGEGISGGGAFPDVKVRVRATIIVLSASLVSGCAVSGYNAGAAEKHLVSAGLSRRAAVCVVDRMGPRFGADRLNARERPEPDELKAERVILKACGGKP